MTVAARACPNCSASIPDDAVFCHKCGSQTPIGIDRETGQIVVGTGVHEPMQRARLQRALGETYEVRRLLGRGGFAEVYVGYDKRLKREIAVKTLRSDVVASESLLQRFQQEAEAVAKLRHPNVIPIYSVGEAEGMAYFTMPLIEGDSLATLIEREGRLPVEEACRILREAAHALGAAHQAGIVHRDIKPENIMLEGADRTVVVMDFGIAKNAGPDAKGLTGTGMLVGTPEYMSPEQAVGERDVGAQSDQYSLAMVGYRLLSGNLPFEGDSVQTKLFKAVTEIPPPLTDSANVPPTVSDAIARALRKAPTDRFPSIRDFGAALDLHGSAQDAPGSHVRRIEDMQTRIASMRANIRASRDWLSVAAVLAMVGFVALGIKATPRAAVAVAALKPDAEFTARQFMAERRPGQRRDAYLAFVANDTSVMFLQKALGFDSTQRRALNDLVTYEWQVVMPSNDHQDNWLMWIGPRNHLTGFRRAVNDSAPAPLVTIDSARAVAVGELAKRGWSLSSLAPAGDSIITRRARTDYLFTWNGRSGSIPWRGADSGRVRVRVGVIGGESSNFSEEFVAPDSFKKTVAPLSPVANASLGILMLALVVTAVVLLIRRQREDNLQWKSLAWLALFTSATVIASRIPFLLRNVAIATAWGPSPFLLAIAGLVFLMLFAGGCILVLGALAESLANESRPVMLRGVPDIARGRLVIPEIVPAALRGYAVGAIMLLVSSVVSMATYVFGVGKPGAPDTTVFGNVPAIGVLFDIAMSTTILPIAAMTIVALLLRFKRLPVRLALLIPALLVGAGIGLFDVVAGVQGFVMTLLATVAVFHYGFLATLVAFAFWQTLVYVLPMIQVDLGASHAGAIALLMLAAVPAVLAVMAYRRFAAGGVTVSNARGVASH